MGAPSAFTPRGKTWQAPDELGDVGQVLVRVGARGTEWATLEAGDEIEIADVTGLQTALDGKAALSHTHAQSAITNLVSDLAGKAAAVHTHAISDITSLQAALDLKAPLASPALTGTPTVPTAAPGTNTTQAASTAFVAAAIAAIIDAAPGALDTLNELAAAIADDANFSATLTTLIGTKATAPAVNGTAEVLKALVPDSSLDLSGIRHLVTQSLTARQAAGTPGTDDLVFTHDGTNGNVDCKSGDLNIGVGTNFFIHIGSGAANATTSGIYFGSATNYGVTTGANQIVLRATGVNVLVANSTFTRMPTAGALQWSTDTSFSRLAAADIAAGNGTAGDASATLTHARSKALDGAGSNGVGVNFVIAPGISKGNGAPATVKLQGTAAIGSGATPQTLADVLVITHSLLITVSDAVDMALGSTTGTKFGTAITQKIGFWNATPVVQQTLATGAGATVDNVISLLQTLGLCKQS